MARWRRSGRRTADRSAFCAGPIVARGSRGRPAAVRCERLRPARRHVGTRERHRVPAATRWRPVSCTSGRRHARGADHTRSREAGDLHRWPRFLPDGRHVLFMNRIATDNVNRYIITAVPATGGSTKPLTEARSTGVYGDGRCCSCAMKSCWRSHSTRSRWLCREIRSWLPNPSGRTKRARRGSSASTRPPGCWPGGRSQSPYAPDVEGPGRHDPRGFSQPGGARSHSVSRWTVDHAHAAGSSDGHDQTRHLRSSAPHNHVVHATRHDVDIAHLVAGQSPCRVLVGARRRVRSLHQRDQTGRCRLPAAAYRRHQGGAKLVSGRQRHLVQCRRPEDASRSMGD